MGTVFVKQILKTYLNSGEKNMKQNLLRKFRKTQSGQAIVEYIIIVALVAIAAITVIGLFGDRLKEMFTGATEELGGDTEQVESSKDSLKDLGKD